MQLVSVSVQVLILFIVFVTVGKTSFVPQYDGNKRISELNIAGTHDSGARYSGPAPVGPGDAKCQKWTIRQQLDKGIRFLDIRLRLFENGLSVHHEMIFQHMNFYDVIDEVVGYIQQNPTEGILMMVKEEYPDGKHTKSFADTVNRTLNMKKYSNRWWRGTDDNPTYNDIRGKFVVIQRFDGDRMGIPFNSFKVQDDYSVTIEVKKEAIRNGLDAAIGGNKNTKFINYISVSAINTWRSPSANAQQLNEYLRGYLVEKGNIGQQRIGIILMDFPPQDIIRCIQDKCTENVENKCDPSDGWFPLLLCKIGI